MTIEKLNLTERIVRKIIRRIDKIGSKMQSKRIKRIGSMLSEWILSRHGVPKDRNCRLSMTHIEY